MTARVLIADDEASIRFVLRETLEASGHEVVEVKSGDAALEALAAGQFEIAFLDIRMPGLSGLDLLDRLRTLGSDTSVVIMTAQNTFENAVEAMKRGALEYLVKPFRMAEVTALIDKALQIHAMQQELRLLRREVAQSVPTGDRLIGKSAPLLEIYKTIGKVAASSVPVLITGESGTGKELVANAIHRTSPRAAGPFVAVNAAAIPRELLESELFGHEKGAFTGAIESRMGRFREANRGTIFLDEIGDMPIDLQAKLLRVLQSNEVTPVGGKRTEPIDVRIIAATHRTLEDEVAAGRFREDLFFRLRVVPLHIPPLRERRDDIPALAEHFVERYATELTHSERFLTQSTLDFLCRQNWPGNVRELENAVKRALVLSAGEVLTPADFAFLEKPGTSTLAERTLAQIVREKLDSLIAKNSDGEIYRILLDEVERPLIEAALEKTDGNQIRAAALLGINRNTLRKKMTELGLELPARSTAPSTPLRRS